MCVVKANENVLGYPKWYHLLHLIVVIYRVVFPKTASGGLLEDLQYSILLNQQNHQHKNVTNVHFQKQQLAFHCLHQQFGPK